MSMIHPKPKCTNQPISITLPPQSVEPKGDPCDTVLYPQTKGDARCWARIEMRVLAEGDAFSSFEFDTEDQRACTILETLFREQWDLIESPSAQIHDHHKTTN
eukprot:779978_1